MSFLDSVLGSQSTTTGASSPWGPQQGPLKFGFNEAKRIYDQQKNTGWYGGDLYANLTPEQRASITGINDYTSGQGMDNANAVTGAGLGQLAQGANYGSNANAMFNAAGVDPTQGIMNNAGQYASNPYMDGMIDAASRDVSRNLFENQLPEINNSASMSGNTNSSRAGVAEGIAKRGAADRIGDIGSTMRGDAYSQGLNMAQSQHNQNFANGLNANAQVGGALTTGAGMVGQGLDQALANQNQGLLAGGLLQGDQQGDIDAAFQQWAGGDQRANELLQRYFGTVGGNNWGSNSTSSTGGTNMGNLIGGGAALAAGIWCWVAREVYGASNPRWVYFRSWLFNYAPMCLVYLYGTYGERFASYISDKPVLKSAVRFAMDRAVNKMLREEENGWVRSALA